jgi:hypothetical protein
MARADMIQLFPIRSQDHGEGLAALLVQLIMLDHVIRIGAKRVKMGN